MDNKVLSFQDLVGLVRNASRKSPIFAKHTFLRPEGTEATLYLAFIKGQEEGPLTKDNPNGMIIDALVGFETDPEQIQGAVIFSYRGVIIEPKSFDRDGIVKHVSMELISRTDVPSGLYWAEDLSV